MLLTGLDIEQKAEIYVDQIFHNLGGQDQFDDVDIQLIRMDHDNPESNEVAHAALRITVTTDDAGTPFFVSFDAEPVVRIDVDLATTVACGLARRARRTALRESASPAPVTVQVLTT